MLRCVVVGLCVTCGGWLVCSGVVVRVLCIVGVVLYM